MEYTWPQILSNKTNLTVDNLAQPGDSAQGQIRKSFLYFKKYGCSPDIQIEGKTLLYTAVLKNNIKLPIHI